MKIFPLLIVSLLAIPAAHAQRMREVVYLRNGSVIRGNWADLNDSLVKITSCCENVFVFPRADILKIEQERARNERMVSQKGYMNFTSFGLLIGSDENDRSAPFSVIMDHVYRFNSFFAPGGFIGFEQLHENIVPLGGVIKLFLPAGQSVLYLSTSAGYSVSIEKPAGTDTEEMDKATGGGMFSSEIGVILPVSTGSALTIGMGYRYNELHYQMHDWWRGDYKRNETYNRLMIRFGLSLF